MDSCVLLSFSSLKYGRVDEMEILAPLLTVGLFAVVVIGKPNSTVPVDRANDGTDSLF